MIVDMEKIRAMEAELASCFGKRFDAGKKITSTNSKKKRILKYARAMENINRNNERRKISVLRATYVLKLRKEKEYLKKAVSSMHVMFARFDRSLNDPNTPKFIEEYPFLLPKKMCANCNHKALAECLICHNQAYCSSFCQKKDWKQHSLYVCVPAARTPKDIVKHYLGC